MHIILSMFRKSKFKIEIDNYYHSKIHIFLWKITTKLDFGVSQQEKKRKWHLTNFKYFGIKS